ncbi:DAZ-associated protein 1 [Porphyridium purpureum]|uniref:DAZ-associated protein 1 n=1 Tax=Porphyridium purpureum TaxID=35688 RepID=A0A5J4Z835_PORPP|nr:DAZ-associated protein 1 [Porphyridium purpureum]|eukprot:POR7710..scf295_1
MGDIPTPSVATHDAYAASYPPQQQGVYLSPPASAQGEHKLFVGGVSWESTEETLRQHFAQYGAIVDVVLVRDRMTGRPRGFGFVTFGTEEALNEAVQGRHTIDGRTIEAKIAVPRGEYVARNAGAQGYPQQQQQPPPQQQQQQQPPSSHVQSQQLQQQPQMQGAPGGAGAYQPFQAPTQSFRTGPGGVESDNRTRNKIFVGGIPTSVDNDELRDFFSAFGPVLDASVMLDRETGNSRGFGFVTFGDPASMEKVVGVGRTSNKDHEMNGKRIEVKLAEPRFSGGAAATRGGGSMRGGMQAVGTGRAMGGGAYGGGYMGLDGSGGMMDPNAYAQQQMWQYAAMQQAQYAGMDPAQYAAYAAMFAQNPAAWGQPQPGPQGAEATIDYSQMTPEQQQQYMLMWQWQNQLMQAQQAAGGTTEIVDGVAGGEDSATEQPGQDGAGVSAGLKRSRDKEAESPLSRPAGRNKRRGPDVDSTDGRASKAGDASSSPSQSRSPDSRSPVHSGSEAENGDPRRRKA